MRALYEMTGTCFSSVNRSLERETAQLLVRRSPPAPSSLVADASNN